MYRILWLHRGRWKQITVETKEEAMAEIADKMILSDQVKVKRIG